MRIIKKVWQNLKKYMHNTYRYILIHKNFLTLISISLFDSCQKVFTVMNISMIGKNLMKHYLKNSIFTVT